MSVAFFEANLSVKQLLLNIQQMFDNQTYQDAVIHLQPLSSINDILNFHLTEQPIYGSARLGVRNLERTEVYARYLIDKKHVTAEPEDPTQPLLLTPPNPEGNVANLLQDQPEYSLTLGNKQYELSNHLGNVQVTLSDKKLGQAPPESSSFTHYLADVRSVVDYYPFGMQMPGRSGSGGYRWGFNGQEKEIGLEEYYSFKYRIHDARLGRFLSIDPLESEYPWNSPFAFAENRPIDGIDLEGLEFYSVHIRENADGSRTKLFVVNYTNIKNAGDKNVKTANGFGPRGDVGITYVIHKFNKDGKETGIESFNVKNSEHGIYAGPNNPKQYWDKPDASGNYPDDYSLSPIDETDNNAKQHDLDFDGIPPSGVNGLAGTLDERSSKANIDFIRRADITTNKYLKGQNDDITGKPVTKATSDAGQKAARTGGFGFRSFKFAEYLKNIKIEKPKGP